MASINELKKLFGKEGITAKIRAYGYAGMVISGPMILGVCLLLSIMYLANLGGAQAGRRITHIYVHLCSIIFSYLIQYIVSGDSTLCR
ncbi:MAG: exopolysaccharide Pel transporter PelG [Alkalibacterium sp.]|nr:exopolysaccharide Pel transporter PelG [Alkalibacterium sp.]